MENEDPEQVRVALILTGLRSRPLQRRPEWALPTIPQPGEAEASSSPGTAAARVPLQRQPRERVVSMARSGEAPFYLAGAVAPGVPAWWPKNKRSGPRGETSASKELLPEQGHAAAVVAAAANGKGSGAPRSSEQERCAETAAASAQVVAAVCYATVAVAGPGPSTTSAPAPANKEEPMKAPSPNSPLDYGTGGSGADDAAPAPAPARPQAKRKSTGGDDEGCSSPAKRGPVAQEEEKPMPISVEPSVESGARAASGKGGAPRPFDLNLPP